MQRNIYNFLSIPSLSTIFWNIPLYKNNILENNKQIFLNVNKKSLNMSCNIKYNEYNIKKENSIHSTLNIVGKFNDNHFKIYETCYYENNLNTGNISLDYSLFWLDVISNDPFYSPFSQEQKIRLKDKVSIYLSIKNNAELKDLKDLKDIELSDNFWILLTNSKQKNLHIIKNELIQNREKSIITNN